MYLTPILVYKQNFYTKHTKFKKNKINQITIFVGCGIIQNIEYVENLHAEIYPKLTEMNSQNSTTYIVCKKN